MKKGHPVKKIQVKRSRRGIITYKENKTRQEKLTVFDIKTYLKQVISRAEWFGDKLERGAE